MGVLGFWGPFSASPFLMIIYLPSYKMESHLIICFPSLQISPEIVCVDIGLCVHNGSNYMR